MGILNIRIALLLRDQLRDALLLMLMTNLCVWSLARDMASAKRLTSNVHK
jgi:hypothetical protein